MPSPTRTDGTQRLIPDRQEIRKAIAVLFPPFDVVEIRIPKTRFRVVAGYFDDMAAMENAICEADPKYDASGIYYTINRVDPALLGRSYNRLKEYAEHTTADANVIKRQWLPVDLDPVRPAGISSSDVEHEAAIQRAHTIADDLASTFGRPIIGDSGNGAHLLYRIDLPNNPASLAIVTNILADLDRRYSDEHVKVDVSCANAARVWKAYGSVARKGDSIPSRPHRLSRILEVAK